MPAFLRARCIARAWPSTSGAVSSVASKDQPMPASSQMMGAPRRLGELFRLEDEDAGAFAEDESAALGVEGARGLLRVRGSSVLVSAPSGRA